MESCSVIKLLVLGQLLSLGLAAEEKLVGAVTAYNATRYTTAENKQDLFTVGGDRVQIKVNGCFHRNNIVCCFNRPMLENLQGARLCSEFGSAKCCFMIPGRDSHPRLPRDLVPLLPSLSSVGQCELRRKGRRVLHCCRGSLPKDPNISGRAAMICSSVNGMQCCYYPFAGIDFTFRLNGSKDNSAVAFAIQAVNEDGVDGDRRAYLASQNGTSEA